MIHTRTSKVKWLFKIVLVLASSSVLAQSAEVSLLFVGDVMQHDGQIQAARNTREDTYDYEDGFKFIKPILNEYDIKVANLEVTLAGEPYTGYPQFSAPDELAETLVSSGFNVILTANNHSCDRGSKGVIRTLDVLDDLGVMHTGTFRNKEERDKSYPLIIEREGMRIAMLNYTYGTNGIEVSAPLIVNYIDSAVIKADVLRAKALKADYIICNMHWGTEYKLLPNTYQRNYEQYCYRLGVDMVIGGHPHVVQPIEQKRVENEEKLTVWSLGNFVSNMQVRYTRGGLMVGTSIEKKDDQVQINKAEYWLVYVLARQEGAVKQYYILPEYDYNAHRPDFLTPVDQSRINEFMNDSRTLFGEHNKGVAERKIETGSDLDKAYQLMLTDYYSVWIPDAADDRLRDPEIGHYIHETVDKEGKSYRLSGMYEQMYEAQGNRQFVIDCKLSQYPKVVRVSPGLIQILEE